MLSIGRYPRLLMIGAAYVVATAAGCGSDGGGGDDAPQNEAGAGGEAGTSGTDEPQAGESSSGGSESNGGSDATGGTEPTNGGRSDGSGGTSGSGGDTTLEGGANQGPTTEAPEFEGVDWENVPVEQTPGCDGGFDPGTGSITLEIDPSSGSLLIDAGGGNLRANGWVCTAPNGAPVLIDDVRHLDVIGTDSDDTLLLDLLEGPFGSALLENSDTFRVDLGAGVDALVIRGTRGDDRLSCSGASGGANGLDLGGGANAVTLIATESLTASLGPGNDSFHGQKGSRPCSLPLVLFGGDDADVLQGGSADDQLNGGAGSDEFEMGSKADGADIVNGGPGADLVSYGFRSQRLIITLCSAPDETGCASATCACPAINGEANEGDTLVNIEDADGGDGPDTITGDDGPNVLSGRGGADTIDGRGGTDQIYGDGGDDQIYGGADDDILIGGPGVNTIDGGAGDDLCFASPRDKPLLNCETRIDAQ